MCLLIERNIGLGILDIVKWLGVDHQMHQTVHKGASI